MRGGLGRTLLTAFLILTILPLTVIGGYAAQQNRRNLEEEVASRLLAIAALKSETLIRWISSSRSLISSSLLLDGGYDVWWSAFSRERPDVMGGAVYDHNHHLRWSTGSCHDHVAGESDSFPFDAAGSATTSYLKIDDSNPLAALSFPLEDSVWVICFRQAAVQRVLDTEIGVGQTGRVRLAAETWEGWLSDAETRVAVSKDGIVGEPTYSVYEDGQDKMVMGAYYPLPGYDLGVVVEQDYEEITASTDRIVATLIALVLAVALGTTAIAAVVIRQITRPVIDLTESAVAMSKGDLDQRLSVRSRDEIGILTYVFNEMASELRSLYSDLEAKVVERTKRLQSANYQIQRRALHLQASQEVSQAITSVRDPDLLLKEVTELIRSHFIYSSVAVYLVAPGGCEARLQACSPAASDVVGTGADSPYRFWEDRFRTGDGSVVGRAIRTGESQLHNESVDDKDRGWYGLMASRVAVPMKMAQRIVGVIAVLTTTHEGIQMDELEVLELLANQVTIALENAQAYERERLAAEQMEAAEAFKARFLANMSRELREPLNTIIGFSRLLMKGVEGPLNHQQQEDLQQIHGDSQRLLLLVNDILAISQLQAGLVELRLQPVSLQDIIAGVMPTASALVRGKEIELIEEIPEDLPALRADPSRLRQVIVHLLNNAAKFTDRGRIVLRAWTSDSEVYVSVSDTGVGIPVEDRERIFSHFEKGSGVNGHDDRGVGLGLALSREFVELHGGQIWVDSEIGMGSTFTFSVPVPSESEAR
jgi:signal transduction histidine kinase/HAMP domain-containing protein